MIVIEEIAVVIHAVIDAIHGVPAIDVVHANRARHNTHGRPAPVWVA